MEPNPYQSPASPPSIDLLPHFGKLGIGQILFSFSGRIPRHVYWLGFLGWYVSLCVLFGFLMPLVEQNSNATLSTTSTILIIGLLVPIIWVNLALRVKRWHDRDKSGKWVLFTLIPIVGPIVTFVECGCSRGTEGHNTYGPDPT